MSTVVINIRHSGQFHEGISLRQIVLINERGQVFRSHLRGLYSSVKAAKCSEELDAAKRWLEGAGMDVVVKVSRKKIKLSA